MNTTKKNTLLIFAGIVNLIDAFVHTIAGQLTLVEDLIKSNIELGPRIEWLGVWHMVTIILFSTSFIYLYYGMQPDKIKNTDILVFISYSYIAFSCSFIVVNIWYLKMAAPQWILLLPVAALGLLGVRKQDQKPICTKQM